MAEERIKDARALIRGKRRAFAYYVAGYSVECALKSCVLSRMIHSGLVFRDDWKNLDCRVHNINTLIDRADLRHELNNRFQASGGSGASFASNWTTVLLWKETSRYESKTEVEAKDLVAAISDKPDGVLRWLKNYW
jgi:hypothetical protein